MRVSRRFLLGAVAASAASQGFANAPVSSLRPAPRPVDFRKHSFPPAEGIVARARLTGKTAFAVADAVTGEMLEVRSPLLPLPPASVTKAITALYALDALGPDHRFRTRLVATGPVRDGRIEGDLVLVGGGDPVLDTDTLGEMARALKAGGVTGVRGKFLVDAQVLPPIRSIDPGQPDHLGYNPSISGLNLNYNRVHFEWKRNADGYAVTMDARARLFSPRVAIARMRVVDRDVPVYTYTDADGSDEWTVARGALGNGGSRWLPVRRPDLYAAEVFQTIALAQGIRLPPAQAATGAATGAVLVEHESAPLRDILRDMLRWSTNLTAEVVGLSATLARGQPAGTLGASAGEMSDWMAAELGVRRPDFVDHSGLGDQSAASTGDLVRALVRVGPGGPLRGLMKDVPMLDAAGNVVPDHPVQVQAKTGTLNFVSALAGYMTARDGRVLAFSIVSADMPRREALSPLEREVPDGARAWSRRARRMQMELIDRWGALFAD